MVLKYLPRFIARPLIRGIKEYSGLNNIRKKRLSEKKGYGKKVEELEEIVNEIKETRADYLTLILTGRMSLLEESDMGKVGINYALVRQAEEANVQSEFWKKKYEESRIQNLSYLVKSICGCDEIKKIPVAVFIDRKRVYSTPRFDRMVKGLLPSQVRDYLNRREKSFKYNNGRLYFIKDKDDRISMGYFVPGERKTFRERVFKRKGETATKIFYKNLKEIEGGLSLT